MNDPSFQDLAGHIVVGFDGSEGSRAALKWAVAQAEFTHSPLTIVSTWSTPSNVDNVQVVPAIDDHWGHANATAESALSLLTEFSSISASTLIVEGHPATALVECSREASLIVVGSRGHGAFVGMLLGSVSQHVAAHAHCPVAVIRGSLAP